MSEIQTIKVIFKTHLDVGFTDFAKNVVDNYNREFIPKALSAAKELRKRGASHGFVWTTGSWLIYQYLKSADKSGRRDMEEAIAAGDISWHGLPFTTHTENMDAELFCYGLNLSQELDRQFGKKTIAAKYTDVPGHTRAMVPYLAKAGIELLHIGVNPASMPPAVPDLFRWRAPTGEEIVVMYNKGDYGEFSQLPGTDKAVYFAHTGDNLGPQSADGISEIFAEWQKKYPHADITAGDLNDLALMVREIKEQLPVVTAEIGDTWIHGAGTDPRKTSQYRALLRLRKSWDKAEQDKLHQELLCIPEHTWGLDEKTHLHDNKHYKRVDFERMRYLPNFQKMEQSWEEQRCYIQKAVAQLPGEHLRQAQQAIAEYKREPVSLEGFTKIDRLDETIQIDGYQLRFDEIGRICHLIYKGKILVDSEHLLGGFLYEVFSQKEYDRFLNQYLQTSPDWAIEDFSKIGCESGIDRYHCCGANLQGLYIKENQAVAVLAVSGEANTLYGCPAKLEISIIFEEERILFDFAWWNKPANRLAEAMWLIFNPIAGDYTVDKLGEFFSPLDVVSKGNNKLWATHYGVQFDNLAIETLDTSLVGLGKPSLLDFNDNQPDLSAGVAFNLYNNIWGTNFPMWYDEDARFRFVLRCGK